MYDKLCGFRLQKETYSELLDRLVESAKKRQLHDLLFNEKNSEDIRIILQKAREKYSTK